VKTTAVDTAQQPSPATEGAVAAVLELEDGTTFEGQSFGAMRSVAGEVVFNTGMVGYPETLTDPSYCGEILVCTYPLIGNYGVPDPGDRARPDGLDEPFESSRIHIEGLIVADYSPQYSHWSAGRSLSEWLKGAGVPALTGIDTRALTKRLREQGTMLGVIRFGDGRIDFRDPNQENLVSQVSIEAPQLYAPAGAARRRMVLLDCGTKHNIIRSLLARGSEVLRVPWDWDLTSERFDGLVLSNGPGDPKMATQAIEQVRGALERDTPTFGICLGHQLLALAIGADTYKLKYGHRSQNQPVNECGTNRCFVTSQNHGYAVNNDTLPQDWRPWFVNLNDQTSEGLRHAWAPFRSVQFHPEAAPGPVDTGFLFDEFMSIVDR
jgi:carbamoyl-phosphate synthase small subunit